MVIEIACDGCVFIDDIADQGLLSRFDIGFEGAVIVFIVFPVPVHPFNPESVPIQNGRDINGPAVVVIAQFKEIGPPGHGLYAGADLFPFLGSGIEHDGVGRNWNAANHFAFVVPAHPGFQVFYLGPEGSHDSVYGAFKIGHIRSGFRYHHTVLIAESVNTDGVPGAHEQRTLG